MNLSKLLSFKPKEPTTPDMLPQMSNALLADLIRGVTAGETIQMIYPTSNGWGDMTPRSLEDYLYVFLQPHDCVRFRVKPEGLLESLSEKFVTREHSADMNDKFIKTLESHGRQIDSLYKLMRNQWNYKLNKENKMADKELLQFAAKAAGILIYFDGNGHSRYQCGGCERWSPLTDDGDALRLAVKLMAFEPYKSSGYLPCVTECATTTRRAIVMVAAEIGRTLG